jgi:hypothetical protein
MYYVYSSGNPRRYTVLIVTTKMYQKLIINWQFPKKKKKEHSFKEDLHLFLPDAHGYYQRKATLTYILSLTFFPRPPR